MRVLDFRLRGSSSFSIYVLRKRNGKFRTVADTAFNVYLAAVTFDDAERDRKSKPCAFANGLGREERIEDPAHARRIYACPRIADRNVNVVGVGPGCNMHLPGVWAYCLCGVYKQIHPDLIELSGKSVYRRQFGHIRRSVAAAD